MAVRTFCVMTEDDTCVGRILVDDEDLEFIESYDTYLDYYPVHLVVEEYPFQYEYNPPAAPQIEDPFANLTLEQKQQIAAILGIGGSETTTTVDNPA
jgi:hypothetical protein